MTNRATLRTYFRAGSLPTQQHFDELIDATLNMQDEGFKRSPENGVEIAQLEDHRAFISLYEKPDGGDAMWSLSTDAASRLLWRPGNAGEARGGDPAPPKVLVATPEGRVGVNHGEPEHELDVAGTLRSRARIGGWIPEGIRGPEGKPTQQGVDIAKTIVADGGWHDITGPLAGCNAFEVMAGTGHPDTGRHSLLHAIAMNAFHPRRWPFDPFLRKRPIRETTAFYDRRCDRLQLRWFNTNGQYGRGSEYCLQIRSRCPYSEADGDKPPRIRFHITQLWLDSSMRSMVT